MEGKKFYDFCWFSQLLIKIVSFSGPVRISKFHICRLNWHLLNIFKSKYLYFIIYSVSFSGTTVLVNLTHLPLTEIDHPYLVFFISFGSFESKKVFYGLQQILPQNHVLPKLFIFENLLMIVI